MSSTASSSAASEKRSQRRGLWILLVVLAVVQLGLFSRSLKPGEALFSNDGPLAVQASSPFQMPGAFLGMWNDQQWLGAYAGSYSPNITGIIRWWLGPYGYTNFHLLIATLILGCCAWGFFRQLGFGPLACVLGGLAAAFNMNFFSNGAWGLSSRSLSLAMAFLALTAVESSFGRYAVIKVILAGLAIGMSMSEGGDNGAIFSVFIAAYAFVRSTQQTGSIGSRIGKGIGRVALMAGCAAVMAAQILNLFVNVAVKGVVDSPQQQMTPEQRWNWATQWSLPKIETLRVIIPGLFGYRMTPTDGSQYWGAVGQDPAYKATGQGYPRHSGSGEYAGVLAVLVGIWGFVQTFRKSKPVYSEMERRLIWFWTAAFAVAVILAWGRHAPLYRLVYALPYFSTVRNPIKFMHPAHMALMILFAYGMQGLWKRYLQGPPKGKQSLFEQVKQSWKQGDAYERRWISGSLAAVGLAFLAFLIYSASKGSLGRYLTQNGFQSIQAEQIAKYSLGEVGMFFVFLSLSVAAVLALQSGWFGAQRGRWIGAFLGLLLVVDLARADVPWIQYYNYRDRYASNPVLDVLRKDPYLHRVTVAPSQQLAQFYQFYHVEWLQHHFQYYGIQALELAQEPRQAEDRAAYMHHLAQEVARYWQLTNTRYILGGTGGFITEMNNTLAPGRTPFRSVLSFTLEQTPTGFTAVTNTTGPFGLIEDTEALPRAKLYTQWQVITNNQAALERLAAPDFDPITTVIVSDPVSSPPERATNNAASVEITRYVSRRVDLKAKSSEPTILLLNDRYDPNWLVEVDGQPRPLLRCNFIMRGVYLDPGEHRVVFKFAIQSTTFYVTLAAVLVGAGLCLFLVIAERRR